MSDAESGVESVNTEESPYVQDGKNKMVIKCKYCSSKILDKLSGNYLKEEKLLPLMLQDNRKPNEVQSEIITEFFHVENMYTFDNIGFTHTVENTKYLSCADCEAGPIGYYNMDTKHSYVALSRVEQV